ncbi:MAG: 4-hydroxy-3-methylbut-2-enyl diphosphate reductase [Treponemataceae bacterium]
MKKITIIRARILGCCMGVKKALDAVETLNDGRSKIYTLGPLIHNDQVLNLLKKKHVTSLSEKDLESDLPKNATIVIRAHGISPKMRQKINLKRLSVFDATCPHVLASQKKAGDFAREGRTIILIGDKNHAEILGIEGFAEENFTENGCACLVVQNQKEAQDLSFYPQKAALIAQTTISYSEFESVASFLKQKIADFRICNTICDATNKRQNALMDLKGVDGIIVIGGKNSANTKRLFISAQSICSNVIFIETKEEIPQDFFSFETIGITAGASTPEFIIEDVEKHLQSHGMY